MEAEGARAIDLSKQVDNLQDLIAKMEQDLKSAAKAAAAASLQGEARRRPRQAQSRCAEGPGRLSPGDCLCLRQRTFAVTG